MHVSYTDSLDTDPDVARTCSNATVVRLLAETLLSGASMTAEVECSGGGSDGNSSSVGSQSPSQFWRASTTVCGTPGVVVRDLCIATTAGACMVDVCTASVTATPDAPSAAGTVHVAPCAMGRLMPRAAYDDQDRAGYLTGWAYVVGLAYTDDFPAVALAQMTVAPTVGSGRTSITATAYVNATATGGSLFCTAEAANVTYGLSEAMLLTDRILHQSQQASFPPSLSSTALTSVSVALTGLVPAADYNVYCLTVTTQGIRLAPSGVLASRRATRTECCRLIVLELGASTVGMLCLSFRRVCLYPL
jgi:hypothetical protein